MEEMSITVNSSVFSDDVSCLEGFTINTSSTRGANKIGAAILTIFPPEHDQRYLDPLTWYPEAYIKAWCGQFEITPNTEKLHAQIFVHFNHNHRPRFDALSKKIEDVTGSHGNIQVCKKMTRNALQCAINYCIKPETRHGNPFIWRNTCQFDEALWNARPKPKKDKADLDKERIDWIESKPKSWTWEQIVHESPESKYLLGSCSWGSKYHAGRMATTERRTITNVIIYYGAGGTGKTTLAKSYDSKDGESEYERYYKRNHEDGHFWGGGRVAYHGQRVVHFEEFGGNEMFSNIKEWCDIGKTGPPVNIKNGGAFLNHETVIFTSNIHPGGWYKKLWQLDPKQFHPFWRRVTQVVFFPSHREDGTLNVPDESNPPFMIDQTEDWKNMKGDFQACLAHAGVYWPIRDEDEIVTDERGTRLASFPWP